MKVLAQRRVTSFDGYSPGFGERTDWQFRRPVPVYRGSFTVAQKPLGFKKPSGITIPVEHQTQDSKYDEVLTKLQALNISDDQISIWEDTFHYLEQNKLPTREFSNGFVELVKAGAVQNELQSYVIATERVLDDSKGKRSIKNIIDKVLEIVRRADLSPSSRARLINNEFVKAEKSNDRFSKLKEAGKFLIGLATDILFRFIKPV